MAYKVNLNGKTYKLRYETWYLIERTIDNYGVAMDEWNEVKNRTTLKHLNYAYENELTEYNPSKNQKNPKSNKLRYRITIDKKKWGRILKTNDLSSYGNVRDWAKPLAIKQESWQKGQYKAGDAAWQKREFKDFKGKLRKTSNPWGAQTSSRKSQISNGAIFTGKDWVKHLQIASHMIVVNSEHFRIAMGHYAKGVFEESFKLQRFNSAEAAAWRPLAEYTKYKRGKRGTMQTNPILREYMDLSQSLKMDEHSSVKGKPSVKIFTDIVNANPAKHKKKSICYAGYHNEGEGTYGKAGRGGQRTKYIKRQFMGHSSKLNFRTDYTTRKLISLYLFDNVFLVQKIK